MSGGDYLSVYESVIINENYSGKLINQTKNGFLIESDHIDEILKYKDIHLKIAREKDGIIYYRGKITSASEKDFYISHIALLKKEQRRKEKRILLERDFLVNRIYVDCELKHLNQNIPFKSKDVSGSGISLQSHLKLPEEFSFFLDFSFIKSHLVVQVQILRAIKQNNMYLYGCQFSYISEDESDVIRQYLYKIQLDEIKKHKRR